MNSVLKMGKEAALTNFLTKIKNIQSTPVLGMILTKLTQFNIKKFNKLITLSQIMKCLQRMRPKLQIQQWRMADFLTLIWIASKKIELKMEKGQRSLQLTQDDYYEIDQIMNCKQGQSQMIIAKMENNKSHYTDRWTRKEYLLMAQLCKYQNEDQIDWEKISRQIKEEKFNPYWIYRCPVQCEMKMKAKKSEVRQWTQEEESKLLKVVQLLEGKKIQWESMEKYFQGRSAYAIKTHYYLLIDKLKLANPYPWRLSKLQLIKQKNRGKIDISEYTYTKVKEVNRNKRKQQEQNFSLSFNSSIPLSNWNRVEDQSEVQNSTESENVRQLPEGNEDISPMIDQLREQIDYMAEIMNKFKNQYAFQYEAAKYYKLKGLTITNFVNL